MVQVERQVCCVSLCVRTITFVWTDLWPGYLACSFILSSSKSNSKIKVVGQSLPLRDEKVQCLVTDEVDDWKVNVGKISYSAVQGKYGRRLDTVPMSARRDGGMHSTDLLYSCLSSALCQSGRCDLEWGLFTCNWTDSVYIYKNDQTNAAHPVLHHTHTGCSGENFSAKHRNLAHRREISWEIIDCE